MKKLFLKKKYMYGTILLCTVVVFGMSVVYQRNQRNIPLVPVSTPSPKPVTWNTYLNMRYRYRAQYPSDTKFFAADRTVDSGDYVQVTARSSTKGSVHIESLNNKIGYDIVISPIEIPRTMDLKSFLIKKEGIVGNIIPGRKGEYELLTWDRPVIRFEDVSSLYGVEAFRITTQTPGEEIADIDSYYIRTLPQTVLAVLNVIPTYGVEITKMLEQIAQNIEILPQWKLYHSESMNMSFMYPPEATITDSNDVIGIVGPFFTGEHEDNYEVKLSRVSCSAGDVQQCFRSDVEQFLEKEHENQYTTQTEAPMIIAGKQALHSMLMSTNPNSHYLNSPFYNKYFISLDANTVLVITGGVYAQYDATEPIVQKIIQTIQL